jgi:hypothetical protein
LQYIGGGLQRGPVDTSRETSANTHQGIVSLELLTVFVVGPMACLVCYDIAKKNPRANILMIILATAELYGGRFLSHHVSGRADRIQAS